MFFFLFYRKDYPVGVSPKLKLYEWTKRNKVDLPQYITVSIVIYDDNPVVSKV